MQWNIIQPEKPKKVSAIHSNVNEPWGHYAKLNKLHRAKQILYDFTYTWNLNIWNS